MLDAIYQDVRSRMDHTNEHYQRTLAGVRTGRASVGLLDTITVEYYGTDTPLAQVATVSVPDGLTLAIQPWDVTQLPAIEKAILASDLGLTPNNDGKIVRINIPPLTAERRVDLTKHVKKLSEEAKVALRNVRRDGIEKAKKLEKNKDISADEAHKAADVIQKTLDQKIAVVDNLTEAKEREIMDR